MEISKFLPYLEIILKKIRKDKVWEKLVIKTGDNILKSEHEKETELFNQLKLLFSKDNLKKISKKMKDANGFRFDDLLKIEMNEMFGNFELEEKDRKKYIERYISLLTDEIREKDPMFATALFLKDFREENTNQHKEMREESNIQRKEILTGIDELNNRFDEQKKETNINIKTISDIEKYLEENVNFDESQQKKVNLDFFDYEDYEFEPKFYESLKNDFIYIKGETVEETVYYVLFLLKNKGLEDKVLIFLSKEEWNPNKTDFNRKILIPFFYAEEIPVIPGNQIIYVYGKEEFLTKESIILEKRKFRNLAKKLGDLELDSEIINKIIDNTNALFPSLKRKFFKGVVKKPDWEDKINHKLLIPALLTGTWSESEGDKSFISELAEKDYHVYVSSISNVINSEDPFIIEYKSYGKKYYRIANLHEAWGILSRTISKKILNTFLEFIEVVLLIDINPKFDFPEEKHWYINFFEGYSEFSDYLKSGILRSMVLLNNHAYEKKINKYVENILDRIHSEKEWFALSEFFNLLIEASPEKVIERIESEIVDYNRANSSNFIKLFVKEHSNDYFAKNYYTKVLFGLEKLLFVKKYFSRIIYILTELSTLEVDYKNKNSPMSTLVKTFCAWYQEIDLSQKERKKILSQVIKKYPKTGWTLIEKLLPVRGSGGLYFHLNKPKFLEYQENYAPSSNKNIIETYKMYIRLVLDNSENNLENISLLFNDCMFFEYGLSDEVLKCAEKIIKDITDNELKFRFYNKLQNLIYKHRYFENANWAMEEDDVNKLEKLFNKIKLEDEMYKQLYLFNYYAQRVPILKPIPYKENDSIKEEKKLVEKLRHDFMKELTSKENIIKYITMLDTEANENGEIGRFLPKYYSDNKLDISLINKLEELKRKRTIAFYLDAINQINPNEIMNLVKSKKRTCVSNEVLIIIFNGLKMDTEILQQINEMPEEFKRKFWKQISFIRTEKKEIVQKMIVELLHYNNYTPIFDELVQNDYDISIYIKTLENLSVYLIGKDSNEVGEYYILEIFKKIYKRDYEKYSENVFGLEIKFIKTLSGNIELKMLKKEIERDATNLTKLISYAYKKDTEIETKQEFSEEQKTLARNSYSVITCIKFCPFQTEDGFLEYKNLNTWVKEYLKNVEQNDQSKVGSRLLGKFLSFAKSGRDENFPNESVRKIIEEHYSNELKNGFVDGVIYSRGVYDGTHGVEELKLSKKYMEFADALKEEFVNTSKILYTLSEYYLAEAEEEKKDGFYE